MAVTVKFFASLRETLGRNEAIVALSTPLSAGDIWRQATDNAALPHNTLCAINLEHKTLDSLVADGDEVAFFPPVTGG